MGKKKRKSVEFVDVELNIMPFIDVFSLLNTFLLFSAVFVSIGIIEVQIPFFSNAPSEPQEEPKSSRTLAVKVEMSTSEVKLSSEWSEPPTEAQSWDYPLTDAGVADFHGQLVRIRVDEAENVNKVDFFSEDDVTYDQLAQVLDAVKLRWEGDPLLPEADGHGPVELFLFEKIIMGDVLL